MRDDLREDLVYEIGKSEIGKARCLNCGENWGSHAGIRCQSTASGDHTFQPLGFALSDRCGNCGETLLDHYKRAGCIVNGSKNNQAFTRYSIMFTDEEFLL